VASSAQEEYDGGGADEVDDGSGNDPGGFLRVGPAQN
jgi:hypothetical protein